MSCVQKKRVFLPGYRRSVTRNWRSAYEYESADMTETVKSENYTNKFLQKDSNPTTMELVTQTNAVKSPTDSPATTKLVYTVEEIARMLAISLRSAYNLCNSTTEFRILRVGGSIRIPKDSFDAWLYRAA